MRAEEPYGTLSWEVWERGVRARTGTIASPFPADVLRQRAEQMGPVAAARGLANRTVSGEECPFKEEHFQAPALLPPARYARRVLFADPAGDSTRARRGDTDFCAAVALGYLADEKVWEVFLAERTKGPPSKQAAFIAQKAAQAEVTVVWQEATGNEALLDTTQKAIRDMGKAIAVRPVKSTKGKEWRIVEMLEPALSARPPLLRVCGRAFPELKAEALAFPAAKHDDLLDAFAGAWDQARLRRVLSIACFDHKTGKIARWSSDG